MLPQLEQHDCLLNYILNLIKEMTYFKITQQEEYGYF